jgi:hypothetical protein
MPDPKGTSSASATPARAAGVGFYSHHVLPGVTNVVLGTRESAACEHASPPASTARCSSSGAVRLDAYRAKYGTIQRPDRILGAEGDDPDRYEFTKQAAAAMLSFVS